MQNNYKAERERWAKGVEENQATNQKLLTEKETLIKELNEKITQLNAKHSEQIKQKDQHTTYVN